MGIRAVGTLAIVSLTERHPIVFIKLRVLGLGRSIAFQVSVLLCTCLRYLLFRNILFCSGS